MTQIPLCLLAILIYTWLRSSFLLFCRSEREKLPASMREAEKMKLLAERWSRAEESVKASFQVKAQEESIK